LRFWVIGDPGGVFGNCGGEAVDGEGDVAEVDLSFIGHGAYYLDDGCSWREGGREGGRMVEGEGGGRGGRRRRRRRKSEEGVIPLPSLG